MDVDHADVVIVGGGVSGLSSAWWLSKAGVDVIVLEKGIVGWEASGRNGGTFQRPRVAPVVGLVSAAEKHWVTVMQDDLGYPIEFCSGSLKVALNEDDFDLMKSSLPEEWENGATAEVVDSKTVWEMMPVVSREAVGGVYKAAGGQFNPQRATQGYAWAAQDHGTRIYQNTTAIDFRVTGGKVKAVVTDKGEFSTDFVVCAAGPQIGILSEKVGVYVPLASAKEELIVTAPVEPMWTGAVYRQDLYGRQTMRGNLAYGVGPRESVEVDGMRSPETANTPWIMNAAGLLGELYPSLNAVPVIRSWAGAAERTPDGLPVIEVMENPSNFLVLTVSAGGFGISPAVGQAVSELVLHAESSIDIDGLKLGRFAGISRDWRGEGLFQWMEADA